MAYYNSNDLLFRRIRIAQWLSNQIDSVTNHSFYGELMCCEELSELEYVSASLEAIECYTPITTEAEDGVSNCLTEEQLDNIFNNIVDITGICFSDKGITYNNNIWSKSTSVFLVDEFGNPILTNEDLILITG